MKYGQIASYPGEMGKLLGRTLMPLSHLENNGCLLYNYMYMANIFAYPYPQMETVYCILRSLLLRFFFQITLCFLLKQGKISHEMEGQFIGATSPMHLFNLNSSSVCTNHIVLFINIFLGKKNTGPTIQRQRQ